MVRKLSKRCIVISGTSYTCHSTTSCCKVRIALGGRAGREEGRENERWGGGGGGGWIFVSQDWDGI